MLFMTMATASRLTFPLRLEGESRAQDVNSDIDCGFAALTLSILSTSTT